jgi:hypothetical protein
MALTEVSGSKSGCGTTCELATVTRLGSVPCKLLEPRRMVIVTALKSAINYLLVLFGVKLPVDAVSRCQNPFVGNKSAPTEELSGCRLNI